MTTDRPRLWRDLNVADNDKAALGEAMRVSTDPKWIERQLCNDYADPGPDVIVKRSRIGWLIWPLLFVFLGVIALMFGYANAAEPAPRVWVIWNETADKQYHPHQFNSVTACMTDIAHAKDGSGKRLSCQRIDQRRQ